MSLRALWKVMCFPIIPHIYKSPLQSLESSFLTSMINYLPFCLGSCSVQFSSVTQLCPIIVTTAWTTARQASLSIAISWSLLKLMSIESVMPSSHLILRHPLILLPSIFLSIRVFSNESVLCIRWPKYWSFSFSISPSNEY